MSLLDDLRNAGHVIDAQFQPATNEIGPILAALVHFTEKGDSFLKAAEQGVDDVTKLLEPAPAEAPATEPAPAAPDENVASTGTDAPAGVVPPAPATPPSPSVSELEAEISDLRAQLASREATANQTVLGEPGV